MNIYINNNGFYDTDDDCPRCGWIVDIVDYSEKHFECHCSQCKKTWIKERLLNASNQQDEASCK